MGRVFVIELEGAVYTCKECHTHLGLPNDIITKKIQATLITYNFSRLFNTFLAERKSKPALQDIFCVGCANLIGMYRVSDKWGPYWLLRRELHGPEGSDDEV
ncbi:Protein yippee-like [Raphanus sativus]|uniref:Protein yippee-like At3g08990 n=1 Tax=Raphanus sativus TaxID=3726 RepID=A0A6J0JJ38_RAPSA|nr:protein yippee-like At3g08990 [Raphanus sativus]XP_056854233.1 protein yippee-like At3g08990 [Raphanus sativus]KAJ4870354.1 Protein yippee-like [Raphanus sativus]KAJ4888190.1 Protein yippee-like [Raphanus sativus]